MKGCVTVVALFAVDIGYATYMQVHGVEHGLDSTVSSPIPVYREQGPTVGVHSVSRATIP